MGEVELKSENNLLIIHAVIFFYGNSANENLSVQIAKDIEDHWNEPGGTTTIKKQVYQVLFDIRGIYESGLTPEIIFENLDPRNNYFRIEEFARGNISFVDGLGSNTGYFKLENLLNNSSTAAHEFGHTLGLDHPHNLDIRGYGRPGIMYPRGTLVDPQFQYDPLRPAGVPGGTMNPYNRKVYQKDIDDLKLDKLNFSKNGIAVLGEFSSVWHDAQV